MCYNIHILKQRAKKMEKTCEVCDHEWDVKDEDVHTGCDVYDGQYEEFDATTCPECQSEVRMYN